MQVTWKLLLNGLYSIVRVVVVVWWFGEGVEGGLDGGLVAENAGEMFDDGVETTKECGAFFVSSLFYGSGYLR